MPWYVLLIIGLASLAVIAAALAYVGLRGWRLAKHGVTVSRRMSPLVRDLTGRVDELSVAAERLSTDGQQLSASVARLQKALARLQVVLRAVNDALRPYYLITGWLSGEREWGDLDI